MCCQISNLFQQSEQKSSSNYIIVEQDKPVTEQQIIDEQSTSVSKPKIHVQPDRPSHYYYSIKENKIFTYFFFYL